MRRPVAAIASVTLHVAIIAGAALIVFPLRLEQSRKNSIEIKVLELPRPAQQAAAARPELTSLPSSLAPTQSTEAAAEDAVQDVAPQPTPPVADPLKAVTNMPARDAVTLAQEAAPPPFIGKPYVAPMANAVAAVNPPLLGLSQTVIPHTALIPHELPLDATVPPVNTAPTGPNQPAPQPAAGLASAAAAPTPANTGAPLTTPAPKAAPRLDRAALGRQVKQGSSGTPTRGFDRTLLGQAVVGATPSGLGRLTRRQKIDLATLIRRQITPCWNPPAITENVGIVTVTLRIRLEPDGQVNGTPAVSSVDGGTPQNQAYVTALVGSVRRAVMRCAPLKLPADLYEAWSDVELNFDPRDVL